MTEFDEWSSGAVAISGVGSSATAAALNGSAIAVAVRVKVHDVESAHEVGVDGSGLMMVLLWHHHDDLLVLNVFEVHQSIEVISGV